LFRQRLFTILLGLALALAGAPAEVLAVHGDLLVRDIVFEGNRKVDTATIRARIKTRPGRALSMPRIREDIATLYAIGYFDDVRVDIEPWQGGVRLYFVLREKPTIVKVEYAGNKELDLEKIREKVSVSPGSMADVRLIDDSVAKIRDLYQSEGYWDVRVFPILRILSENRAALTFQIVEGEKVRVTAIRFRGNRHFPDDDLRDVMETGTKGFFSFLTDSGKYVKDLLRQDMERIKSFYHNEGFIEARVGEPELIVSDDRKTMEVVLTVEEGQRYDVGRIRVSGPEKVPPGDIRALIRTEEGGVFRSDVLRADTLRITEHYANLGYAFAEVAPRLDVRREERKVNIEFRVRENRIVRVGRIRILGNTRTRDKVIRREIRLNEGDVYRPSALRRSYERINNLKYFETVEIVPRPRPAENRMDLDIKVKEQSTGNLTIGGGYSSVDGLLATVDITEGNLMGRGQTLKLSAEKSDRNLEYSLSFREPWLLDRPVSLTATIYNQEREYFEYTKRSKGGGLTVGRSFAEYYSASLGYSYEIADVSDVSETASDLIRQQEGEADTSKVTLGLTRDSRDNVLYPRRGSRNALSTSLAGLFLGDNRFYKVVYDSSWHWPLFRSSAFGIRGRIGWAEGLFGETLPVYERFYVGGIFSVRGYSWGDAGPKDENGENIGGNKELIFNVEYTTPIVEAARLYGVVFYDAGSALNDDENYSLNALRQSVGAGFRWLSPVGPIRLEWGMKLDPEEGESKSRWDFTFGTFF